MLPRPPGSDTILNRKENVMAKQLTFSEVQGYATYQNAVKRGTAIAAARADVDYRWVVIALPNGRFTPMAILNNQVPGGPGLFLGERNFCMAN
jgi:hypothetical protein